MFALSIKCNSKGELPMTKEPFARGFEITLDQAPIAYQVDPQAGDVINRWEQEANLKIPVKVFPRDLT